MNDCETFMCILCCSMRYEMHRSILTIQHYYGGKEIIIDLSAITPEIFELLTADADFDEQ